MVVLLLLQVLQRDTAKSTIECDDESRLVKESWTMSIFNLQSCSQVGLDLDRLFMFVGWRFGGFL